MICACMRIETWLVKSFSEIKRKAMISINLMPQTPLQENEQEKMEL